MEQSPKTTAQRIQHDISKVWPEWQIVSCLGRGSYGTVYRALRKDNNLESHAAIKVISIPSDSWEVETLRSEGMDDNSAKTYLYDIVSDFTDEIRMMEQFKGLPNIVSVEDYKVVEKSDEIGWDIYIRMELLTPFNQYACDKQLTENEVIKLGCDICTALEICSQCNIIHRDVKPANIFVNKFGYFKLGDFGVARTVQSTHGSYSQKGTFFYMAPEVAYGNKYDARVDIYSLGLVLYRLLNNNRMPFLDTEKQLLNPNERRNAMDRRMKGDPLPAPVGASPAMAQVILRACAFDPNQRFASATEMKNALQAVATGTYRSEKAPEHTTPMRKAPVADKPIAAPAVPAADSTTPVRKAAPVENPQDGKTVSVRKVPTAPKQKKVRAAVPKHPRNATKRTPWIIGGAVAGLAAILLVVFLSLNGFRTVDGQTYYLKNGSRLTGLQEIGRNTYYFTDDGVMVTGKRKLDGNLYYFSDPDGKMLTGWQVIDGNRYYFNDSGVMLRGLNSIDNNVYYFQNNGIMLTGWKTVNGKQYYFANDGTALTGWQEIDGNTYYFADDGVALTDWQEIDGKKYFFDKNGKLTTDQISNDKTPNLTGFQTIEGKTYYFNENGKIQAGFQKINGNTYYFDLSNGMVTGWLEIAQSPIIYAPTGGLVSSKRSYYFNENGIMQTGWQKIDKNTYYFDSSGLMVIGKQEINGKTYHFDKNGVLID